MFQGIKQASPKYAGILLFVTLLTVSTVAQAALEQSCGSVFASSSRSKSLEHEINLDQSIRSHYSHSSDARKPILTPTGEEATLIDRRYIRMIPDKDISHSMEVTEVFKIIDEKIARTDSNNYYSRFEKVVQESIELVLKNYALRRDWTPEFRAHLFEQALKYARRSTYIQYYADRELKGTLKIIAANEALQELLPVEENLKIKITGNGGQKFELANFSIEKEFNSQAFTEILFQLMLHAEELQQQPEHQPDEMIYFTYADAYSLRMYNSLGFKPVPGFETPIEKDGTKWVTVGISTSDVLNIPKFMQERRPYWDPDVLERMLQFFPQLSEYSSENLFMTGFDLNGYKGHIMRPTRLAIPGLFREYRSFRLTITNFGDFRMYIPIPVEFLPLREGSKVTLQRGRFELRYENGTLYVKERNGTRVRQVALTIDPKLHLPKDLQILKR